MVGLKILRKHRGLTQKQLGDFSQIHLNTVNRYEGGSQFPDSFEKVQKLASVLGCEPWHLFHPDPLSAMRPPAPPSPPPPDFDRIRRLAREREAAGTVQPLPGWQKFRRDEPEDRADIA